MEKTKLRAVGYRRVSMREQIDGHSLDAQEKNIRDYVAAQGWELIEIYTDAGISAKKDSHRPDLERMLAAAEAGKLDVIVVDKIDRFYRHLAGLLSALDHLHSINISFASVQERLDFTSPWGKLMLTVLGILAEIYLDNLRQETLKGKQQRARKGLWNGLPPYGYCKGLCADCEDPNGKGYCPDVGSPNKTDGKRLILHPVDSEVVKVVYSWYLNGNESDGNIAEKLNHYEMTLPGGFTGQPRQKGHPGKSEPGPFTRDVVRDMLKRVFYTGKLPYVGSKALGDRKTKRSELDQAVLYDGMHPALVSNADYQRVQELREILGNNCRMKAGVATRLYPLSGILYCGYCGKSMRGVTSNGKRAYRDSSQIERRLDCPQPLVHADNVEQQLRDVLQGILNYWQENAGFDNSSQLSQEAEDRFGRAKELYLMGEVSREVFQTEKDRYEEIKNNLQYADPNAIITLCGVLRHGLENWDCTLPTDRKKLLRTAIRAAFLRGNVIVAVQPTDTFIPLVQPKYCNCGEGGIRTRGRV